MRDIAGKFIKHTLFGYLCAGVIAIFVYWLPVYNDCRRKHKRKEDDHAVLRYGCPDRGIY